MRMGGVVTALTALILTALTPARAEAPAGTALPCELQISLLAKVLSFDRSLQPRDGVVDIVVLYQADYPEGTRTKEDFMRAARAVAPGNGTRLRFKAVQIEGNPGYRTIFTQLPGQIAYITPMRGLDVSAMARAAAAEGVRTVSGVPEYVYDGIALTFGIKGARPAIYVNLATARAQGSDLSSQLLKLANVVE